MNQRHRIFIAINLPSEIKQKLAGYEAKFPDLPARWTPEDNLHITLVFLGDMTDEQLGEICMVVKEVATRYEGFEINLNRVDYGPDNKIPPRMLWAHGERSKELSALRNELQEALLEKVQFAPEHKGFTPHITLARISTFAWRQINPEERPQVGEDVVLQFSVDSIEVIESELKKGGPQYTVIESCPLST